MAQGGNVPDPLEMQFSCKLFSQLVLGEIGAPKPFLMTIQSFWVRKYLVQTYPIPFSQQINIFLIKFWAPAQAQPGRASPSPGPAGPRSGQDLPGRDFPDLRFLAEVGNCPRRSRGGRESAPGGRESTVWGAGRANPSRAGIFPTSANSQRSGKTLPGLNLPDPQIVLPSQGSGSQIRAGV